MQQKTIFRKYRDLEGISTSAAALFSLLAGRFIGMNGVFTVSIPGGATPKRLFEILGTPPFKDNVHWSRIHFFWTDERFVGHDHADSNFRLFRETLLGHIAIPGKNIHPVRTDASSAEAAAARYEEEIRAFFNIEDSVIPSFDLVLLGIGRDGHIASIFPGSKSLVDTGHIVVLSKSPYHEHQRITLTLKTINQAKEVVFLASGAEKATVIGKTINERDMSLPASRIHPEHGNLLFLVDDEAGLFLHGG